MPRTRPNPTTGPHADGYADTGADALHLPGFLGYGPDDRPHYRHAPRAFRI